MTTVASSLAERSQPINPRRLAILAGVVAAAAVPLVGNDYWLNSLIVPTIVMGLAGLGLNLLTGYAGLVSLGSAAFMAIGAFSAYNLLLRVPLLPLPFALVGAGLIAAVFGVLFGLPSLRIKGFYLSASTLGAQFFFEWLFTNFHWFSNDSLTLTISAPRLEIFGYDLNSPGGRYLLVAGTTVLLYWLAHNIIDSRIGRDWMAIRDMETAAAVAGIPIGRRKLLAYGVSSFFCGIAGALWAFCYLGTTDAHAFDLDKSFQVLFIVIIGGSASLAGNFLGAAFIVLTPIALDLAVLGLRLDNVIDHGTVIARNTAFTYKGKPVDVKQIGRELGVRYLLEGSVRRLGDKVEINAQLISTETGAHVWADRFDGERNKLGDLQVEFVSRLANSLGVELVKAEALRSMRERPNNPDAADLAMRAAAKANTTGDSKSINSEVIDLNERALALDPQNESAMVSLSFALNDRVGSLWSEDPAADTARAEKLADSALALQPDDAWAHMAKAQVFFTKRQWKAAISQAEAALADDPNNASAHANFSFWNMFLGHSEDGFAGIEKALRLSPRDPGVPTWQFLMCHLHTHLAQWEQAIEWCGKSIASGNDSMYPYVDLAAANAWAGHDKEAKEAVAQLRKLYPDFTVQSWAGIHWSDDPTFNEQYARIVEGLRKAGLPEGEKKTD